METRINNPQAPDLKSEINQMVRKGLYQLGLVKWGYSVSTTTQKFSIEREDWSWYVKGMRNGKLQYFKVHLNFDTDQTPASFSVWHAEGRSNTEDISEAGLNQVLKLASQKGALVE